MYQSYDSKKKKKKKATADSFRFLRKNLELKNQMLYFSSRPHTCIDIRSLTGYKFGSLTLKEDRTFEAKKKIQLNPVLLTHWLRIVRCIST